jgi:hypothetical protein
MGNEPFLVQHTSFQQTLPAINKIPFSHPFHCEQLILFFSNITFNEPNDQTLDRAYHSLGFEVLSKVFPWGL